MSRKGDDSDRIGDLEFQLQQLEQIVRHLGDRDGRPEIHTSPRWVRTVDDAETESYPAAADRPNTYPIVFVDGTFDQETGWQNIGWTDRQSAAITVACNGLSGRDAYIPKGSILPAWNDGRQWWLLWIPPTFVVKTTVAHASGATAGVHLWFGDPGTETVSSPAQTIQACNRTSVDIAAGKFCKASLLTLVDLDGNVVMRWYIEPWEC